MADMEDLSNKYLNSEAISDDFFIEIVETKLKIKREEFKLKLVLLSPATGKNENYVATLYRAKVKIVILETKEIQTVDVVIKVLLYTMPDMDVSALSTVERFVYEDILTSFEEIWLERAGEVITFAPRMIKSVTEPYNQIVMDDLKAEGFALLDRKVGANFNETKLLLKKIAQFHATGAFRYQKEGEINSLLDRKVTMAMPEDNPFSQGFVSLYHSFVKAVKGYGDCDEFVDNISQWDTKKIANQFELITEPMRSGFQLLNHGDLWLSNTMFKLDAEANAVDVRLIDFQLPHWGGPSDDLFTFLINSVADDFKIKHFDEFVAFYHENLVESLKKLKFDKTIPSLEEVHLDLIDKGWFACCQLILNLFMIKDNSAEDLNLEMILGGADDPVLMNRVFNNENYMKAVKSWLPFFSQRGFFDAMMKKE